MCRRNGSRTSIFVLQQADLREPNEIEVIRRHLAGHGDAKTGIRAADFRCLGAESAARAHHWPGQRTASAGKRISRALEEQINFIVSSSGTRILKLRSASRSARIMLDEVAEEVSGSFETIKRDEEQLARLHSTLEVRERANIAAGQRISPRRRAGMPRIGRDRECRLLERKLSFWRTWKLIFSKGQWQQDFQLEVESKLRESVQPKVENAVQLLETDLRGLWPQLQDTIEAQFAAEL